MYFHSPRCAPYPCFVSKRENSLTGILRMNHTIFSNLVFISPTFSTLSLLLAISLPKSPWWRQVGSSQEAGNYLSVVFHPSHGWKLTVFLPKKSSPPRKSPLNRKNLFLCFRCITRFVYWLIHYLPVSFDGQGRAASWGWLFQCDSSEIEIAELSGPVTVTRL